MIFEEKMSNLDNFFGQASTLDPPFSTPIDFRVSGSQEAYIPQSLKERPYK